MNREETIEAILDAAAKPLYPVVPSVEFEWSDGRWRSLGNVPHGISPRGNSRIAGYVMQDPVQGTTFGSRYPTEAACIEMQLAARLRAREEFRADLKRRGASRLAEAASYWLKIPQEVRS